MDVIDWLLDSDPAIRWQVLRDLTAAAPDEIAAERARVAREGLGAQILSAQAADGAWAFPDEPAWLPTLFHLQLLRMTGVDPADPAVVAAMDRLAAGFRWHISFGAKPFFDGEVEPCINGGALAIGSYFARSSPELAHRLIADQLADGGWNCDAPQSTCASFHSTICVLEGLLAYERTGAPAVAAVRRRGEEYLLERGMFRRRSTGAAADPSFTTLAFPHRYYYDVLRGLDHLRSTGAAPDPRIADAIAVIEQRRRPDGHWLLDVAHDDALGVSIGETVGEPSRWITLRALRVLRWAGRS